MTGSERTPGSAGRAGDTGAGILAPRPLAELTAGFAAAPPHIVVSDVTLDSRSVSPGALFLACRGHSHHGLEFARQAVARGARAVLFDRTDMDCVPELGSDIFVAGIAELGRHVGTIADRFFGAP